MAVFALIIGILWVAFIAFWFLSALTDGIWWLLPLVIACLYFMYSASAEEKIMTEQFPDQYPAYKKRTKMLIPLVF